VKRLALAMAAVVSIGILFVAVFPTRALLEQRKVRQQTVSQLRALEQRTAALDAEAQKLKSDPEIERLAREHYNLVRPGEEAYAMLPSHEAPAVDQAPPDAATSTTGAPPSTIGGEVSPENTPKRRAPRAWYSRLWSKVAGIF
jgi:cell division protein FtsB